MAKRTELKDSVKTINRGIEIAIRPSATQAAALSNWMGVARMAWNWMLAEWNRMYSEWELQESLLALASGNATGLGPYKIAAVARALGLQAEWLKPELPAHSSKKDKRQWTWGLRITDGGAVLAAVEPQPRASGNLDCSALLSALAARRQQAADLAECRRAGYEEPTNPRAVRSSHLQDPELRAQKQQKIADKAGKRAARLLAPNPFPKPAVSIVHFALGGLEERATRQEMVGPHVRRRLSGMRHPRGGARSRPGLGGALGGPRRPAGLCQTHARLRELPHRA